MSESAIKKKSVRKKRPLKLFSRKNKRTKSDNLDIPKFTELVSMTYRTIKDNWKILGSLTLIYGLLYFVFVRISPEVSVSDYEEFFNEYLQGTYSGAVKTFTLAGVALASLGTSKSVLQNLYGFILVVIFSLIFIWVLRRISANKPFKIRDAFYKSQTALIPFLLIIGLITIQLLPFGLGGLIYSITQTQNIALTLWENGLFLTVWLAFGALSFYWISNSVLSLYAVTLPGMYPMEALSATKKLIRGRRLIILRKLLWMALLLTALFFTTFLFVVAIFPDFTYWFVDISTIIALPIAHIYVYGLYRSLI